MAATCALLALGSACTSSPKALPPPPTTTTVGTTASTVANSSTTSQTLAGGPVTTTTGTSTQATSPASSLATLILATVPNGFTRQPDDVGQTGPTDITKAALDDVSRTARHALVVTGFVAGYQRQWTSSDGYTIDTDFLYQFQTDKGAQGYAQHWRDTLLQTNQPGFALQSFTPAFIPGGYGLEGRDKTGSTAVVILAKDVYAVEVTVNAGTASPGSVAGDQSGAATAIAVAQSSRLP